MANISKITIGNTTYDVKDAGAVRHRAQDAAPYVNYVELGHYYNSGSTAAYVRIKLPVVTSWCMMTMELTIRQKYGSGYAGKLFIYGNYSSSADWNAFSGCTSGTLTNAIKVYGSGKQYIYIGGLDSWGGLTLDKMTIGDSATSSDLSGIVIDGVSALPSTYQTATMHYNEATYAASAGSVAWNNVSGKPSFATVATSGSYNDLSNKPTIPAAQVQTDWNATSGMGVLLHKPSSLPASDVYAWAKAATKPTYTASEVGALAVNGKAASADRADFADVADFASAASNATMASKLSTGNTGGTTTPVYFSGGVPVALSYTIAKSVPSDAKFTDTTYESKAAASGGTAVSLCTTGEKYTWNSKANAFSVTDSNPTLAWSTKSKVATIAGVDIHVTMPANPGGGGGGIVKYQSSSGTNITVNSMSAGEMTYVFMSASGQKRLRMPSGGSYIVLDLTGVSVYNDYGSEIESRLLQSRARLTGNSYTEYRYWNLALVVRVG